MIIQATRDSVAAGDDADAPHIRRFELDRNLPVIDMIGQIVTAGYLPGIAGGRAAWSVTSGRPVAVVAQEWESPRSTSWLPPPPADLDIREDVLHLHFNYHAQVDPHTVLAVLERLRLRSD